MSFSACSCYCKHGQMDVDCSLAAELLPVSFVLAKLYNWVDCGQPILHWQSWWKGCISVMI